MWHPQSTAAGGGDTPSARGWMGWGVGARDPKCHDYSWYQHGVIIMAIISVYLIITIIIIQLIMISTVLVIIVTRGAVMILLLLVRSSFGGVISRGSYES